MHVKDAVRERLHSTYHVGPVFLPVLEIGIQLSPTLLALYATWMLSSRQSQTGNRGGSGPFPLGGIGRRTYRSIHQLAPQVRDLV